MRKFNRIITMVLDSVGIGETEDSKDFGDFGVNTLANISKTEGLNMPNLKKLGLGNIADIKTIGKEEKPRAYYTKMQEKANGKDTLAGHWEMMGVTLEKGFDVYVKEGFPDELIKEFEEATGRKVLANKEANGMKVIKEYYHEHVSTGSWIVYTSVDSTFQIAAHEEIIPLEELYKACEIARELTKKYNVARVIARPFIGDFDNYERTSNRHDYALNPPKETVLNHLNKSGIPTVSIGKISDIFNGSGISKSIKTKSNMDGVDKTIDVIKEDSEGFVFVNLVDFDSKFGHPRDVKGYKEALEEFDARVPEILENLKEDDLFIITADHGNDPTYKGNDHTREYVPLILYSKSFKEPKEISKRGTFEDLGELITDNFEVTSTENGTSFLKELI